MVDDRKNSLDALKTSSTERRLSLAKASLIAGSKVFGTNIATMFSDSETKDKKRKESLSKQSEYLVNEIGKLKGSVVKIGQMLALYGEHFLPEEVTSALHLLNNQTKPLSWAAIEPYFKQELGAHYHDFEIDKTPLGSASLAQVHKATIKATGEVVVLKLQYPGIGDAIDSDLNIFKRLIKLTNVVPQTKELEDWFNEIRDMLNREVNYNIEAATTKRFYHRLKDDPRYVVPRIYDEYSNSRLLVMSYERGVPINSDFVLNLPQNKRDALGEAALEITLREIFEWGEMQTDPNFGNYLLRLSQDEHTPDQIVLLDFGAIREFEPEMLDIAHCLLHAGYHNNGNLMLEAMKDHPFFADLHLDAKTGMAQVFLQACEPFRAEAQYYSWQSSDLHARIVQQATTAMTSKHLALPPKEFMFVSRKFVGLYTFLTVINAHTNAQRYKHMME